MFFLLYKYFVTSIAVAQPTAATTDITIKLNPVIARVTDVLVEAITTIQSHVSTVYLLKIFLLHFFLNLLSSCSSSLKNLEIKWKF